MAIAAEPDIDLLLLDINMPIMDGLTLLSDLRCGGALRFAASLTSPSSP